MSLHLMSHALCPYVQRAVISLTEKGVPFEKTMIDLANKPDWFLELSPLGKTPLLVAEGQPIFESSVILEYLEDTQANPLHPADATERARHRAWVEFSSAVLGDIAGLYSAKDEERFEAKRADVVRKVEKLEQELGEGPWFAGEAFSLVDSAFGPVFRYFDVFDRFVDLQVFENAPKVRAWRAALAKRPSVATAVSEDYGQRLEAFLRAKGSYLSGLMTAVAA